MTPPIATYRVQLRPGFGFREAIPSWEAETPTGTWVETQIRARADAGDLHARAAGQHLGARAARRARTSSPPRRTC